MANENRTAAPSGTFATADGALNIAANKQEQWETLCAVLGRDELVHDPRFRTRELRKANRDVLRAELETTLRERTAREWDEELLGSGVPAAPVVSVAEALANEQVRARGLVAELPSPAAGDATLRLLGGPVHVDGEPATPDRRPPRLGEHTDEVLSGLGLASDEIARLREEGVI
jgi:crotonobetainyl-CoA:carnitine CoA-transferase CaiB-like acyl-CoA transferase